MAHIMKRTRFFLFFILLILIGCQIITWGRTYKKFKSEHVLEIIPLTSNIEAHQSNEWKFKNFSLNDWWFSQNITLEINENGNFFRQISSNAECFVEGTDWNESGSKCVCKKNFFGSDCGIPSSVWHGHYKHHPEDLSLLKRRKLPRRLIQGILFNHEFEMLDIRMATTYDVVDVFLIQESNYTSIGDSKALHLLHNLQRGWLSDYQDKILYIPLLSFPSEWNSNGWLVEDSIRNHLSLEGLPLIQSKAKDDIFLLFDADEVPSPEALLFLKLYDGISEPIQFGLRWNLYGFFWLKADSQGSENLLLIHAGASLEMLESVFENKAIFIRSGGYNNIKFNEKLSEYKKTHRLKVFNIGVIGSYGGFHCSWCLKPEGIRTKLLSAQKDDKPRWGDYPEKIELPYIASLIKTGKWFDDSCPTLKANENDSNYAPKYVYDNPHRFEHLLNP